MPKRQSLLLTVCLAACAAPTALAPPPAPAVRAASAEPPAPQRALEPADIRRLPHPGTFADLVDVARFADTAGQAHSESGCLVKGTEATRLEADLLPGARPLPHPLQELAPLVAGAAGSVTLLSAWGNVQGELADVILLSFTTTTPKAVKVPILALFMTRNGTYVRGSEPVVRAHSEALTTTAATALLTQLSGPATVYVTAEADLPLGALTELLRSVPNRFELALAVALPKGTRLPEAPAPARELLCPEGLPVPGRTDREGELDTGSAQAAVTPLREAALSCALATGGRALLGGRLVLAMRVGADGKARELCFVSDDVAEPMLRRCLISAARDLALPAPRGGFADLNVPLDITLEGPTAQRASCE
jgi:hypothetical protein